MAIYSNVKNRKYKLMVKALSYVEGDQIVNVPPEALAGINNIYDTLTVRADGTGELVRNIGSVDLVSLNWKYYTEYNSWQNITVKNLAKYSTTTQKDNVNFLSDNYSLYTDSLSSIGVMQFEFGTSGALWINNGSASVTPTGMFIYELSTPTTTQLTASEVNDLLAKTSNKIITEIPIETITPKGIYSNIMEVKE